jgi:hypothetical protein
MPNRSLGTCVGPKGQRWGPRPQNWQKKGPTGAFGPETPVKVVGVDQMGAPTSMRMLPTWQTPRVRETVQKQTISGPKTKACHKIPRVSTFPQFGNPQNPGRVSSRTGTRSLCSTFRKKWDVPSTFAHGLTTCDGLFDIFLPASPPKRKMAPFPKKFQKVPEGVPRFRFWSQRTRRKGFPSKKMVAHDSPTPQTCHESYMTQV